MNSELQATDGKRPLISFFLQPYPYSDEPENSEFCDELMMNIDENGKPLYLAGRMSKPPTATLTPGHSIKGGYTPSEKYKPASYSPSKMDKRAGK